MHLTYPIKAILMYFAILFAPPDVNKITVGNSDDSPPVELVRNGETWTSEVGAIAVEGENLVANGPHGRDLLKISDFVSLPGVHDWNKNPVFALGDATTLEKTATGFTCHRNSTTGEMNGIYEIGYVRGRLAAMGMAVNVLGAVVRPGAYGIPEHGSVLDAIAAAGGATSGGDMKKVSLVRGPAGTVPKVTQHDVEGILKGDIANPALEAHDTIFVAELNR